MQAAGAWCLTKHREEGTLGLSRLGLLPQLWLERVRFRVQGGVGRGMLLAQSLGRLQPEGRCAVRSLELPGWAPWPQTRVVSSGPCFLPPHQSGLWVRDMEDAKATISLVLTQHKDGS